ncbi:MAG: MotA/TolQ/ExbB proton channel family protein [Thermoguttaceae bacterium]|nr:MotA/TolQ/ExbB proton channel family protein [Thermoguttaceae bacterium]
MKNANRPTMFIIRSPILWGLTAAAGFYGLVHGGLIDHPLVQRYFASHPVEYVATGMFFIGLAMLALRGMELLGQYPLLGHELLGADLAERDTVKAADLLLSRLDRVPDVHRNNTLVRRLRDALKHVRARGSTDAVDEQLAQLADAEADRTHQSYALFRVIVWAIPILGFLGTVIGITHALANLAPDQLENSLPSVMDGLGVAFDTTALALALTIVLMFAQFLISRAEDTLLRRVDEQAREELEGRFEVADSGHNDWLPAIRPMTDALVQVTERLVERQAAVWRESIDAAAGRWTGMADEAGRRLREALDAALVEGLKAHGREMRQAQQAIAEQQRHHWDQVEKAQVQGTHAMASLQASLAHQAEVLERAVAAVGEVTSLEKTLNRNLAALRGAQNFEKTVLSLAAAIPLISARLAELPDNVPDVELEPASHAPKAA